MKRPSFPLPELSIKSGQFVKFNEGNVKDDYFIECVLGEGGFGKVYLVTHKITSAVRAMKQIKKHKLTDEDEQTLLMETEILKELDHSNIVKLFEIYYNDKNYFLITEYCPGGELMQQISSNKVITEHIAAKYMKQVFSAVQYCHAHGIVHRDLKLENLLLDRKDVNA